MPAPGGKYGGLPVMRSNFSSAREDLRRRGNRPRGFRSGPPGRCSARIFGPSATLSRLRFDGDQSGAGQPPGADHAHRADAAAQVQRRCARSDTNSCHTTPSKFVGGKTVAVAQLKQTKMSADGIQRFVAVHTADAAKRSASPGGTGPGLAQPLKCVSGFTAGFLSAGMFSGSMWTSTSRTAGISARTLFFTAWAISMRMHHGHLRVHLDVHVHVNLVAHLAHETFFHAVHAGNRRRDCVGFAR